jgi:CRISPR-associated protein Csy3
MARQPDSKNKTASVLSFNRHLDPSDGRMTAGNWDQRDQSHTWPAIKLQEKSVRGTISNRLKNSKDADPAKLEASIQNPNLQRVDVAMLPMDQDTLCVSFHLRVLGHVGQPSACNDEAFRQRLKACVQTYQSTSGFKELASRYAYNLANGRFLWRNRMGAEQIEIVISRIQQGQPTQNLRFDALRLSLQQAQGEDHQLTALTDWIEQGLSGQSFALLSIKAYVRMGGGLEVYPSQELVLDKSNQESKKSKILYALADGAAAMHSQKIGNALRTIDTWYPEANENGPIAVEPYGSVTSQGRAYRQPRQKQDFYSLFDGWVNEDKVPEQDQQHYVMAVLVRGGVFGESDK